jgi:cob(I)alamin adenosyltransferase
MKTWEKTAMRVTKVYTRNGDHGRTRLVGNQEVEKSCQRIEAYGTVDELNSMIGMARAFFESDRPIEEPKDHERMRRELLAIQNMLFILGGDLATLIPDRWPGMPLISPGHVEEIEEKLDAMNADLSPLEEFILPSGPPASAALHMARTICRRAEREVLRLGRMEPVSETVIPFLNRLSDYLFVMARWSCHRSGSKEDYWKR